MQSLFGRNKIMVINKNRLLLNSSNGLESFEICSEMMSDVIIEWTFTEVSISKKCFPDEKERFFSDEYIGSSHLLGDEGFIFNPLSLRLNSICFIVPEKNFGGNEILKHWLDIPVVKGVPIIDSPKQFSIESPLDYRYFSTNDNILLCISGAYSNIFPHNCNRLRLHPNIELLCVNGMYIGYILKNSTHYLTRFSGEERLDRVNLNNSVLIEGMKEFFSIVHEDNFEKFERQDENLIERLMPLKNKLLQFNNSSEPTYALWDRCKVILEDYYL